MNRSVLIGAAIFAACLAAYISSANISNLAEGWDTLGTRILPFAILHDHRLTLDSFSGEFSRDTREIGYLEYRRGHLISHYPIGAALVALPLDLPVYVFLRSRGKISPHDLFEAGEKSESWVSAVLAATAVLVLFVILSGWAGDARAAAVALVFGLGTTVWATASQQLWQHGPDVLFLLLGIYFLSRPSAKTGLLAAAGLSLGFLFGIRPAAVLFTAAGLVYSFLRKPPRRERIRSVLAFLSGACAGIAPFLFYNVYFFGSPLGGPEHAAGKLSPANLPAGFLGLFFSPNRGLLVFTPVALVGFAGMGIALRQARSRPLLSVFSVAALSYALLHCAFPHWAGGWSFGPRYLIEILPVLALTSVLALRRMSHRLAIAAACLTAWSIGIQLDGGFCFGASRWEARVSEPETHAWDWRHLELWEDFLVQTNLLHHEIVSGPLPDSAFRVHWGAVRLPSAIRSGQPAEIIVRCQNAGNAAWLNPAFADLGSDKAVHAVRLAYRWLSAKPDQPLTEYGDRADLASPLPPGEWVSLPIVVNPPGRPGDYRLQFDLVQELVAWFEEQGAERLVIPVHVR